MFKSAQLIHPNGYVSGGIEHLKLSANHHLIGLRRLGVAFMIVTSIFIAANLFIAIATYNRVMPFTRIGTASFGWQPTQNARQSLINSHHQAVMTLSVEGKAVQINAANSGIMLMLDETLAQSTSGWRKLPLVGLVSNLMYSYKPLYSVDQTQMATALKSIIPDIQLQAKEARVIIPIDPEQGIEVIPAGPGKLLNAQVAAAQVAYSAEDNTFALKVMPDSLQPKWRTEDYQAFLPQLESARKTTITIKAGDQVIKITGPDLQKLLTVDTDGVRLAVMIDQAALAKFLDQRSQQFYQAPLSTKIALQDGIEISRESGMPGKTLDTTLTAALVSESYKQGVMLGEAVFAMVDPNILYKRSYTNNDQELYKLIDSFAQTHAGKYRVAAVELAGPGNRSAFYNADESIVTASTNKLFSAYAALLKVELGEWTLSTPVAQTSLDKCLTDMMVVSDNVCALALQYKLGWSWLDSFLQDKGFASTKLNNSMGGHMYSTARDQMALLTGLYNTELLNQTSRDYLFGLMSKQIYRKGIVAGSGGSLVADKVGFLDDFYHDVGIVYGPKSTYALVIMTEGAGGFNNIRLLSEQIYNYYNR
jgi:beta-lactamase class A